MSRDTDIAVAQALGLCLCGSLGARLRGEKNWARLDIYCPICDGGELKHYETDIAAAWEALSRLIADGWEVSMNWNGQDWACRLDKYINDDWVFIDSQEKIAPAAICAAFLKASEK